MIFNTIQKEDEEINVFLEHFMNTIAVVENYGGGFAHDSNLYLQDEEYKNLTEDEKKEESNIEAAKEQAWEQFLAYGFLTNCDKRRYGNLVEDLDNTYTFSDNKFPKPSKKHMNML